VKIDPTHLKVNVDRQDNLEVLQVKIELPEPPVGKVVAKVAR
jgi:cell division topological specificity factor